MATLAQDLEAMRTAADMVLCAWDHYYEVGDEDEDWDEQAVREAEQRLWAAVGHMRLVLTEQANRAGFTIASRRWDG